MSGSFGTPADVPRWVSVLLLPALNLFAALVITAAVILVIGENPLAALSVLIEGAFGNAQAVGYTLYYATNLIFTGLAVAIAFHCGLFNIGAEGQAYIAGLGVGLVALGLGGWPWPVALVLGIAAAALFGAGWAFIPAWLQAKRGSHIVITTIMFNFIAASLMTYMMVDVLKVRGSMSPESPVFDKSVWLPFAHEVLAAVGVKMPRSPLNITLLWALACCVLFYLFVWKTRWGYALRTVGQNERAAVYAGISPARQIIVAMVLSGALAGFVAVNDILGVHHKIILNYVGGVGFTGIAVALMGRNHPVGIIPAAILFGALTQGGSALSFEYPTINRELVIVIQGLVILFAGALENMFRPTIEGFFRRRATAAAPAQ